MNLDKLKQAEAQFLQLYPQGFADPGLLAIGKKHRMPQMIEQCQALFDKQAFNKPHSIVEEMIRMVSRSSMVSMFEKPKFKDFVKSLPGTDVDRLSEAFYEQLYGDQHRGFEDLLNLLMTQKLAKWSLMTILPNYVWPHREVFVKPTTAKGVIHWFELQDLVYKPRPSWDFYQRYRANIMDMKQQVVPSLAGSNAAFSGFLMMSLPAN
ncbi:hypothetical protein ACFODZ_13465 [Marinicella sediminis]|uniref:Uncharacterized protein n=1 Tax=Marinicella sediminis TaxID=1792834 RepID=A0ABV7JB02_9GAMM|nr:hypothetical protein [Marinicella sediminis]